MRLSDDDLHSFIAGWKSGTKDYIAGMRELERRKASPALKLSKLALSLSCLAVLVSIIAPIVTN